MTYNQVKISDKDLIFKYVDELKMRFVNETFIEPVTTAQKIINEYEQLYEVKKLSFYEKKYLEFVWMLFKIIFWDRECIQSLNSKLIGPFFIGNGDRFEWITINISPDQQRYINCHPFGLYNNENKRFYYINKSLKDNIFENYSINSVIKENYIIEDVNQCEASFMTLQFRVLFYNSKLEIGNFRSNNLIHQQYEYEKDKYISLYSLSDYGIEDLDQDYSLGQNLLKISDLQKIFEISAAMFKLT